VILRPVATLLLIAAAGSARADGYCDLVEGSAEAESDLQLAPTLYGSFGYVKAPTLSAPTEVVTAGARVVAGVSYNLVGIAQGRALRARGRADCRRHQALDRVQGETVFRALEARLAVYGAAFDEADRMLGQAAADLKARRATAQDVVALRLRANEIHDLAADARRQLDALPAPAKGEPTGGALAAYYQADADIEDEEGTLRRLEGFDVTLRAGYDRYLDRDESTPIFAMIAVGVNLGALFEGSANERAAIGRRHMIREQHMVQLVDTTITHLKATVEVEARRADETAALVADLETQLAQLERIGSDESRRYRQTVWFDWVKVKAEHAYLETHVTSLRAVIGEVEK
jgi:hypothetical protein